MLEIGSVVDEKYKVLSQIGHGGMSTVYLAINSKANKPWAIKEVRKEGVQNYEVVHQSLIMEMDLLKKLKHPNLPSIIDVIDREDDFLIVMDYVEGVTLNDLISGNGPQAQEEVISWAIQICDVLEYLHTRVPPIVYRDMKPSNIMLKSDGSIVLIDFGSAREFKQKNVADTTCLGTQGYAAPEQFGGLGQTDARTDIYCLGATLYHLLTGHNPSEPPYEMYPITFWDKTLSGGLEGIILKCTQRNPDDRFQSAQELRQALQHYKELEKPVIKKYKRNIALFIITVCMGLCCGIGSLLSYSKAQAAQKREYEYLLNMAERSTLAEDSINYYLEAIAMDSQQSEAYLGLIDYFIQDASFSEAEEAILLKLNASVNKYLQKLQEENEEEYADLCFNIGNAYWFYYSHEESRQSNAVPWFEEAVAIYEKFPEKEMEYKRCNMYVEIGNFYKKILAAQIAGTDAGMYGEYWQNLIKLKKYNDELPDRELITVKLYKEIVTRAIEYSKYLKEDGIAQEEIMGTFNEIQADIKNMKLTATSAVLEEIEAVEVLIDKSSQMITSSYKGGK